MNALLDRGATVVAHDPVAHETCKDHGMKDRIDYSDDVYAMLDNADALIICTDWSEFKQPDFEQMKKRMATPVIFDGRNLYHPTEMQDQGFVYYSVGREIVTQPSATVA